MNVKLVLLWREGRRRRKKGLKYKSSDVSYNHSEPDHARVSRALPHLALGAHEAGHVLHHADDWNVDLLAESDFLSNIQQSHFLVKGSSISFQYKIISQ